MVKKTVSYTDFNGIERTEDLYFHMSLREMTNWSLDSGGNAFAETVEKMIETTDVKKIFDLFQDLVRMTYGVKSEDGLRFVKDENETALFLDSPAFDELYFELLESPDKMNAFIESLMPEKINNLIENETNKKVVRKASK